MRVIEQKMNQAIANGKDWRSGNTAVQMNGEVANVYLYGHKIAEIGEGYIQIWDGGHQTTTTKSRLNAIFAANGIPGEGVFQKAYTWFVRVSQGKEFVTVPFFNGIRLN